MGRIIGIDEYLNMLSEKTIDNSKQLRKSVNQRRNGMEDLYGVCFSANGDADSPATFYISLSPDYVYLQRFAFKLVIRPFTTTVKGATASSTVSVDNTSLGLSGYVWGTDAKGNTVHGYTEVTPNPHKHTTQPHTHNIVDGMTFVNTSSTNWRVTIAGVDITPYLVEQQDGAWISGEGIYPNNRLEDIEDFYDILDVASVMTAEGNITNRDKILKSEFKQLKILSDAPFGVDLYLYIKYSTINR